MISDLYDGQQFGWWTVVSCIPVTPEGKRGMRVECLCVCGTMRLVLANQLECGKSLSCGCLQAGNRRKPDAPERPTRATEFDYNRNSVLKLARQIEIVESGCWEWMGETSDRGYGRVTFCMKRLMVHRLVWEYLVGPIPEDYELDHLCKNTKCCNVAHLEPVTHQENVRRSTVGHNCRSRTQCPRGHAYDIITVNKKGRDAGQVRRRCRQCMNAAANRYNAKRRAAKQQTAIVDHF